MTTDPANPKPLRAAGGAHAPLVDWLRILTALAVVCTHARVEHWVRWNEFAKPDAHAGAMAFLLMARLGHEAVIVFFVLSGYLVGGKLLRRCLDGTFGPADFVRDRFTRIYTPLVPSVVLTAACVWIAYGGLPPEFAGEAVGNLLQLQGIVVPPLTGNAPLWSLGYEIWFYALACGLGALAMHGRTPLGPAGIALALVAIAVSTLALLRLETSYLLSWLMGAFAYVTPRLRSAPLAPVIGLVLAGAGAALSQAAGPYQDDIMTASHAWQKTGTLVLSLGLAMVLPRLDGSSPRVAGSRLARLGVPLAGFSYSLYLTHFPLQLVMRTWHEPFASLSAASVALFALKVALCVAVAWAFSVPFERSIPRLRAWLRRASATQPVGSRA